MELTQMPKTFQTNSQFSSNLLTPTKLIIRKKANGTNSTKRETLSLRQKSRGQSNAAKYARVGECRKKRLRSLDVETLSNAVNQGL